MTFITYLQIEGYVAPVWHHIILKLSPETAFQLVWENESWSERSFAEVHVTLSPCNSLYILFISSRIVRPVGK